MTVFVVKGNNPPFLGRDGLRKLKLNSSRIFAVINESVPDFTTELIDKYPQLFSEGYGSSKDFKAQIQLREKSQPKFCKARPVPYSLNETVEKELDRLEAAGIIFKWIYYV